jgi:hypothetical protein
MEDNSMDDIQRLLAIEEIRQLKARYFRCMDTKQFDELSTVFAPDASFDSSEALRDPILGTPPGFEEPPTVTGLEELIAYISAAITPVQSFHMGHSPEIEITSDTTARGIVPFEDVITSEALSFRGYGYYHETYERINGQWRIKTSVIRRRLVVMNDR